MKCAYCGKRAIHADHIAPKTERRTLPEEWATITVGACFSCNMLKGTRRLVPVGYERLEELRELTGKQWEPWNGSIEMLREIGVLR